MPPGQAYLSQNDESFSECWITLKDSLIRVACAGIAGAVRWASLATTAMAAASCLAGSGFSEGGAGEGGGEGGGGRGN